MTLRGRSVELAELNPSALEGNVRSVTLLGLKRLRTCSFDMDNALRIHIPRGTRVPHDIAQVFRIEME